MAKTQQIDEKSATKDKKYLGLDKRKKSTNFTPVQHGSMDGIPLPTGVDLDELRMIRLGKVRYETLKLGLDAILLLDPVNTRYATDTTDQTMYCSHFETRFIFMPAYNSQAILYDYASMPFLWEGIPTVDVTQTTGKAMSAYYYFAAAQRTQHFADIFGNQVSDLMDNAKAHAKEENSEDYASAKVYLGVDRLSQIGSQAVEDHGIGFANGQEIMSKARKIKDLQEFPLMNASIAIGIQGVKNIRELTDSIVGPGQMVTENQAYSLLVKENIANGGQWMDARNFVGGTRTFPWFRECSSLQLKVGSLLGFTTDMVGPYGYACYFGRTWLIGNGTPTQKQTDLYAAALKQHKANISKLLISTTFEDLSKLAYQNQNYGQHQFPDIYRGVGMAQEYPIIPKRSEWAERGYDGVLEENMVLTVETYIAEDGSLDTEQEGVRLQDTVHVTKNGPVVLTDYEYKLSNN